MFGEASTDGINDSAGAVDYIKNWSREMFVINSVMKTRNGEKKYKIFMRNICY